MKKIFIFGSIILTLIIVGIIVYCFYFKEKQYELLLYENLEIEINEQINYESFIKSITNGTLINGQDKVDTSILGEQKIILKIKNNRNRIKDYEFSIKVIDTQAPTIEGVTNKETTVNKEINLLEGVTINDNSNEIITPIIEGEYSFNKVDTYTLKVTASDSSGNTTNQEFTLTVNKFPTINKDISNKNPYYIKINRLQNMVMIYGLDNNNEYTNLIKVFVCSTGTDTPTGTFNTTDKYTWRALYGNVFGQYATRITGSILFHSVPYYSANKNDLEYEEYNKLGTKASLGCIRLAVIDAKWIYDNCPKGTTVEIYDSADLEGITKPSSITIDVYNENRGWDPTDPDENNPWN